MESFDAFMGSKMGFLSVAFVNIFVFQRKGKVGSSVVSRNFLFVGVGWVLFFYTFSSDTSTRGAVPAGGLQGWKHSMPSYSWSKMSFLFVTLLNNFVKKRQRMVLRNKAY